MLKLMDLCMPVRVKVGMDELRHLCASGSQSSYGRPDMCVGNTTTQTLMHAKAFARWRLSTATFIHAKPFADIRTNALETLIFVRLTTRTALCATMCIHVLGASTMKILALISQKGGVS